MAKRKKSLSKQSNKIMKNSDKWEPKKHKNFNGVIVDLKQNTRKEKKSSQKWMANSKKKKINIKNSRMISTCREYSQWTWKKVPMKMSTWGKKKSNENRENSPWTTVLFTFLFAFQPLYCWKFWNFKKYPWCMVNWPLQEKWGKLGGRGWATGISEEKKIINNQPKVQHHSRN